MARFRDIPQFTTAHYSVQIDWDGVDHWVNKDRCKTVADLDPDFQRGHVWTEAKQIAYVEFVLQGGRSAKEIYWNCPGWMDDFRGPLVLVDGKQRLTAVRRFMQDEIRAFGHLYSEYEDKLMLVGAWFMFYVNNLPDRKQVLQWYLDLNSGGVVHTNDELDKVRELLREHRVSRAA